MAVNTLIEGNILKINVGGAKVEYWNAAWVGMEFIDSTVVLTNYTLLDISNVNNPYVIPFADFQYDGASITTESGIATALSDKIG